MSEKPVLDSLDEQSQEAIIGHMLEEHSFFIRCVSHLKFEYFQNPRVSQIFRILKTIYKEYKKSPTIQEIKAEFYRMHPAKINER